MSGRTLAVGDAGIGRLIGWRAADGTYDAMPIYCLAPAGTGAASNWKEPVRVATTANGTLSTAYANGQTVDGVTLATGDRLLIKDQSSGAENGIYVVAASGAPTRATDADSGAELLGATLRVMAGTVNGKSAWTCETLATITPGTTALVWRWIGDVMGPTSATDGAAALFDGATGRKLKQSATVEVRDTVNGQPRTTVTQYAYPGADPATTPTTIRQFTVDSDGAGTPEFKQYVYPNGTSGDGYTVETWTPTQHTVAHTVGGVTGTVTTTLSGGAIQQAFSSIYATGLMLTGGSGRWIKVSKTYADMSVASTTTDIEAYSLPARAVIHGAVMKSTTAFAGPGVASLTLHLGLAGNTTAYGGNYVASNTVTDTFFTGPSITSVADLRSFGSATSIRLTATAFGANLNVMTAGAVDIYLLVSGLDEEVTVGLPDGSVTADHLDLTLDEIDPPAAAVSMGGFRVTDVDDPVDDNDAVNKVYLHSQIDGMFQPLDSDLTAIAALTTTSFGRSVLESASAAALFAAIKQAATTSATGVVELATDGETASGVAVQGNDSRLADARTPTGSAGGDLTGTYPNPALASIVTGATKTKITYDAKGRVTAGADLAASDLPALNGFSDAAPALTDRVPIYSAAASANRDCAVSEVRTLIGVPAGTLAAYGASSVPTGWLECDGSAVSRSTYADLFAVLSTTWGAGNGSTTFNLPDFRGRAVIGVGTGSGLTARTLAGTGGAETHVLSTGELPSHTHNIPGKFRTGAVTANAGRFEQGDTTPGNADVTSDATGSGTAHANMQPWVAAKWVIKT